LSKAFYSVITGTGKYIPTRRIENKDFLTKKFFDTNGDEMTKPNQHTVDKLQEITTIKERRYVTEDLLTSDIAFMAAEDAINSSSIDRETLDYIIVAHNFGDVKGNGLTQLDMVPSLAAKVKHKLKIKNPETVAYDLPFGCPGWLQGMIQADYFIKSGDAKKVMIIGAEVLSRVFDPHDRDGMLYSDGAGATILEAKESDTPIGILSHKTRSDTYTHAHMLYMGGTCHPNKEEDNNLYLKMYGRKLYQYALETVPGAIKACLDKNGMHLNKVHKILIHQANGKMDDAIIERLYKLYDMEVPENVMPMTISWLGNSSVATVPTLLDLILKREFEPNEIKEGDNIIFASVGAGMNINAALYKA
jgi:3-oxoacyl-[acyl-carrier-protein] synthase-3